MLPKNSFTTIRSKMYWESFQGSGISVFLTILLHIPKLVFVDHTNTIFIFRSTKQTKCIWYIIAIGELSVTYIFLGAFSAVRVIIILLRGRCFSCSEYLGPMISPPSQYFLPLSNLKLEYFSITKPKAYLAAYDSFSDVPESRVWFASKNLTPCRMH